MLSKVRRAMFSIAALAFVATSVAPALALDAAAKRVLIHQELLKIYQAQGKPSEAQSEFQILLGLAPSDAQLHHDFAQFLARKGDFGTALMHFRTAAKQQPFNQDFQGDLGNALLRAKDYGGAIEPLRRGGQKYQSQLQLAVQYQQQMREIQKYNEQLKQRAKDNSEY